jgi:hypothetical protein
LLLPGADILVLLIPVAAIVYATTQPSFKGAIISQTQSTPEIKLTALNVKLFTMSSRRGKAVLL